MKKKLMTHILVLVLILSVIPVFPAQAATKYTGKYSKIYKIDTKMFYRVFYQPEYSVTVNKIKNNKITFQVMYAGINGSPLHLTKIITAKLKKRTASFKWKDGWGNSGTGTIKLYKGYVKIKMKQKKANRLNRATLDTQGKYMKIKKRSNNRKLVKW